MHDKFLLLASLLTSTQLLTQFLLCITDHFKTINDLLIIDGIYIIVTHGDPRVLPRKNLRHSGWALSVRSL